MKMEEIKEAMRLTEEFLDKIDIKQFVQENQTATIDNLMVVMELLYADDPVINKPPFNGSLFNYYNEDEFEDYLANRYGDDFHICEVTTKYINFA